MSMPHAVLRSSAGPTASGGAFSIARGGPAALAARNSQESGRMAQLGRRMSGSSFHGLNGPALGALSHLLRLRVWPS